MEITENVNVHVQVHDCAIASKLLNTCLTVQFLGVTATFFAFGAFILGNLGDDLFRGNNIKVGLYSIPIFLAYSSIGLYYFMPDKLQENPKALLWLCWIIFFLDTVYLGVLVGITGGPSNSTFTPLFLLIPSAVSCFCQPRKIPFWFLIIWIMITYMTVSVLEFKHCLHTFQTPNDGINLVLVLRACFTIGCIATAAYCYVCTYSIRRKCVEITMHNECENLYL